MQQERVAAAENGVAVENPCGATPAYPDGIAARERDGAACDCDRNGGFAEHREPRPHGLRPRRRQSSVANLANSSATISRDIKAFSSSCFAAKWAPAPPAMIPPRQFYSGMLSP